jgi:hypothetical protein
VANSGDEGFGSIGEIVPTLLFLLIFSVVWGLVQFQDGSFFVGLLITPPLAAGMLSAATVRMAFGRNTGGVATVGGVGIVVFALAYGIAAVTATVAAEEAFTWEPMHIGVGVMMGILGSFLGALALGHYLVTEQPQEDDEEEEPQDDGEDIDYSTEPEDLVCLLTNQVVNRDHDQYVVCHNKMNVTQVCHAVYLKDYVHLLDGRCRRCYQGLRKRDLEGMG